MKVAMLLHKDLEHDSRVRREAAALAAAGHEVTVVDVPDPPRRLPLSAHRLGILWSLVRRCVAARPDVVHAHDVAMLPPGRLAAALTGAALVYDSHELATGVPYRSRFWALFVRVAESLLIGSADAVITVSGGIAERLRERYGLEATPTVVRNVCALPRPTDDATSPPPGVPDLRAELGIGDAPLVLHQGALGPDRGGDVLAAAVASIPGAHLLFLGADPAHVEEAVASCRGALGDRVHALAPAPLESLLEHTAQADVGVSLLQPSCENHRLALPNKVFEYLAAGVPVVTADLPELSALVAATGAGRAAAPSDPAAVAAAIGEVLEAGPQLRERAVAAGRELDWERESEALLAAYEAIEDTPTAVVLVRNPASHDGRVLRVARSLREQGERPLVLGVTSEREPAQAAVIDGVPVLRLTPRSPLRGLRRLADAAGRGSAGAGASGRAVRGAAAPSQPTPGAEAGHLSLPVRLNRWLLTLSYYRRAIAALRRRRPRIVHCNDYNTMWPGLAAKYLWGAALVYDSHELWPDRNGRSEPRWWLIACESLFVRAADEVLTTSPGHAKAIARRHRIPQPRVVRNLPEPAGPLPAHSANGAGLPGAGEGVFAYAGAVTSGRGLEQAIDALPAAGAARLRILGPGNEGYRSELRARADALGVAERVEFAAPVAPGAVLAEIAGAAAGLALIQPVCRSYELSLPNKLFEYLAAGLPVLASDLPVLGPFVREGGFGISVTPADTAEIAAAMAELANPAGNARFRRGAEAARGGLDWRHERAELADAHRAALGVGG